MEVKRYRFWLFASIVVAILFGLSGLSLAFQSEYVVQDDARQHVFWLQRLNDSELFPDDLIANYFSSVAPAGYKLLYWMANVLGIKPFLFSKIIPIILGIGTTFFLFSTTLEIFPVPFAGFVSSLLLNQNLWLLDDLVSGTPRAFFYILFIGFIYFLLRQNLLLSLVFIILQGLFYPQVVLISAGILGIAIVTSNRNRKLSVIGFIVAVAILGFYKLQTAEYSDVISLEVARQLPEFQAGGRSAFFSDNPVYFWLSAPRSGYFPREWQYVLLCSFGLFISILIKYPDRFSLVKKINYKFNIVVRIILASLGLFLLSNLLLFVLHLPSRYSQHTWRIVIALVDGITITILLDWLLGKLPKSPKILRPTIMAIAIAALLYPTYAVQSYPYRLGYVTGEAPKLYQFLQQQPKDTLIATLSPEADSIPSFARRSVLVAEEYSIPYHLDYYQQIRQRAKDLIAAQYSLTQDDLSQFIRQYRINLWLLDKSAFTSQYLKNNNWLRQYQPETDRAIALLEGTEKPILATKIKQCSIFHTPKLELLNAKCILDGN